MKNEIAAYVSHISPSYFISIMKHACAREVLMVESSKYNIHSLIYQRQKMLLLYHGRV